MTPTYDFHTPPPPNPRTTRLLHWLFYLGALLLLVAAVHSFYLYFTHWSGGGEEDRPIWQLVLGLIYLMVSGLIAYAAYAHSLSDEGEVPPQRYVRIQEGKLVYALDQFNGRQEIALDRIEGVRRASVRDLLLELRGGERVLLPIYLIDDEEKQTELEEVLAGRGSKHT